MGFVDIMDTIFGGGEKRGLLQGIALLVLGIILGIVGAVMVASAALSALLILFGGNPAAAAGLVAGGNLIAGLSSIPIILGVIGLIWWVLRNRDIIS